MPRHKFLVQARLLMATYCISPAITSAAAPADASAVLASARIAAGQLDRSGVRVETGTETSSGLQGRWRKATDLVRGRTHTATDFGVFRTAEVWDGKTYWRQDQSGGVHPLNSSFALANHLTEAWLASFEYLSPKAGGAKLERLENEVLDGKNFTIIRATPEAGQTVDLWFDSGTHRLSRTIQIMPTYTKTVLYDDYRNIDGVMVAAALTIDDGVEADRDVFHVEHVSRAPADHEFDRPQPTADFSIAGGKTQVPIEFDGDVIVEAKLNGQGPFAFILDTGGHDILTPEAAKVLGLKPFGAGASGGSGEGTVPIQYAQVEKMDIGGMTLRNQPFTVIALPVDTIERGARPPLAGILGLELFERFAVRLDYGKKLLSFQPLSGYQHLGAGKAIPIFFTDDQPLFEGRIAGVPGAIALDTGNSGTLIVQGAWADANGLEPKMTSGFPSLGYGMGGASPSWSSRVDCEIAGAHFQRVIARYAKDKKGTFSSRTEAGNMGNELFANFTLDFDYGRSQVWFETAPGHVMRVFDRAGMSFFKQQADAFKITAVAAGTPAAEAGLRVDDDIVAINGTPASQLSGWDLRRAVRGSPGSRLTLSLVRTGQAVSADLILRELLP